MFDFSAKSDIFLKLFYEFIIEIHKFRLKAFCDSLTIYEEWAL